MQAVQASVSDISGEKGDALSLHERLLLAVRDGAAKVPVEMRSYTLTFLRMAPGELFDHIFKFLMNTLTHSR